MLRHLSYFFKATLNRKCAVLNIEKGEKYEKNKNRMHNRSVMLRP